MQAGERIYVAGHTGLAGSAIVRALARAGHADPLVRRHAELELTDQAAVRAFFAKERPEYVFVAAAKVGGILANDTYPADFIDDNLGVELNVIREAWRSGVKRLLFLGSSCIYPRDCPQPMKEEHLLTGPLEPTNRPYAIAKIAGIELCWAHNRQHGTRFLAAMPTNLYGPGDSYDLAHSHVLPALIRKIHEAKLHGERQVTIWGSGRPRREFLYSDDMAEACVHLMRLPEEEFNRAVAPERAPLVNIGAGSDLPIAELAALTAEVIGFRGEFVYDSSKPDGTPRKLMDSSRMAALGWKPRVGLREGIALAYEDFRRRFSQAA
ncbi:MAG TPA: GDP-L-fucose synthase [Burkholderiales bacterium]|jgi:GDP-L-fucose synthase|nr:GDP-L-fucose synthase [Burkholderiales bacterium]